MDKKLRNAYFSVAKIIAHEFSRVKNVSGVTVGGSLARKFSDINSDIEMYVYYRNELPCQNEIKSILKKINARMTRSKKIFWFHEAWGHHTFFEVKGIKVELGYRDIKKTNERIKCFMEGLLLPKHGIHDTPFGYYESGFISCINESITITDKEGEIKKIKNMVKIFPEKLRKETIRFYYRDAATLIKVKINQAVLRNDSFNFNACLAKVIRSLNICLFAINYFYYPGDKWNREYISKFKLKPENYELLMEELFRNGDLDVSEKKYKLEVLKKILYSIRKFV